MALQAGLTLRIAPHFHCRAAWAERLRLNGGIVCRGARFHPRDDWRSPSADELRLLVAGDVEAALQPGAADLALLAIPPHLRARWWELAEQSDAGSAAAPGFEAFVTGLAEFLRFKRLPVPARCVADIVVSRPGQPSTRVDDSGTELAGLAFRSLAPPRGGASRGAPIAAVNLGDESTRLVVLNLPLPALQARLTSAPLPATASAAEVLGAFVARWADYPLIGVTLDPGEGLWLPAPPPAFDGWTVGKQDLDAVLVLQGEVIC